MCHRSPYWSFFDPLPPLLHLSAPVGRTIDDFISHEALSLQYASVDDAVHMLIHLGRGAQMAKVDLKSAFCMVPVHMADWELLGICWNGLYYVDTCFPFSLRLVHYLFDQVASALVCILQHNYDIPNLIHY